MKNKLFPNGRIHASEKQDLDYSNGYYALSVSPFDKEYDNEVEPGVLQHCKALVRKGYLPLSSCEGHYGNKHYLNWYVMIAVPGKNRIERIFDVIQKLKDVPGIFFKVKEQVANVNGQIGVRVEQPMEREAEYNELNRLFMRNHTAYSFLYFGLFKDNNIWSHIKRLILFRYSKRKILNIIEELEYDIAED
tara:strand:- start:39 stop:611 length:573 start_codon:yes stop_codon:yes gene_type:complete